MNVKSKANHTTTLQQKNDSTISATTKLAEKAAEAPEKGNQAASEVVIQQQQITIDELLAHIVKLEARVIALEDGLWSTSHVTSVLQEQITAKTDELEIYSRRPCIVLTVLCKEENENLSKLKKDVVDTLSESGISKEEVANKIDKNNTQNTIIKFKSHSFKKKNYLKRKAITKRDVKIKPSLTKHQIELLKDANTLTTDNPGTNFLFAYADVHRNLKFSLKDARNGQEVVKFAYEKDFSNLFVKSF